MSRQQSRFGRWKLATSVLAAIPLCMYSAVSAAATEAPAVFGIPVDFILLRRADGPRRHHTLQARLHRVQDRARTAGVDCAHAA